MGMNPNIQFAVGSGINTDRGILVDERLMTNIDDIYACGDCAQIYNSSLKDYWVSTGWHNAEIQGKVAAENLLGESHIVPYPKETILSKDYTCRDKLYMGQIIHFNSILYKHLYYILFYVCLDTII